MPKPARAAIVVALLIGVLSALSSRVGPIMLIAFSAAAFLSAAGIWMRRAWSAYGFALLLILFILSKLVFAIIGQKTGTFLQNLIAIILYAGIACLFLLAGHMLANTGAPRGTPIPWLLLALLMALPLLTISIPSNAMENTLLIGDSVFVNRFSSSTPAFGDLIAFRSPQDPNQILIRRVLGLPGDRLHSANGNVYRNDKPALASTTGSPDLTVPSGKFYVLCDAHNISADSRNFGFIDRSAIVGRPKFILDSLAPDPADLKSDAPNTAEKSLVEPLHPPVRRWERIFKPL